LIALGGAGDGPNLGWLEDVDLGRHQLVASAAATHEEEGKK
jgi:hypothetical protein